MGVRRFETAVDPRPLLRQCRQTVDAVDAMQLFDIARNQPALGVVPGALANAIAGVNGRSAAGRGGTQIGAPLFLAGARRGGELLAVLVGAGQAAEISALAQPRAGDEKRQVRTGRCGVNPGAGHRHGG